jgi:hypothetical protein
MLRLLGLQTSPAVRIVLGLALLGVGVVAHAYVVAGLGAVCCLWGVTGLLVGSRERGRDDHTSARLR